MSPENAARLMEAFSRLDVRPLLADIAWPIFLRELGAFLGWGQASIA